MKKEVHRCNIMYVLNYVVWRNVLILCRAENERSASHDVTGIDS